MVDKIEVDFERNGWGDFYVVPLSRAGTQSVQLSVVNGRGRISGPGAEGNYRAALVHGGTNQWPHVGIKALWWGASAGQGAPRSQLGHIHNVQQVGDRSYGVGIWHDTAFAAPGIMNVARVAFATDGSDVATGTTTVQSGRATVITSLSRSGWVVRAERVTSPVNTARYTLAPIHIVAGIQVGDLFTVVGAANATFNVTNAVVVSVEPENGVVTVANVGGALNEWCAPGVTFSPTSTYRGNLPYWVRSEAHGDTTRVKTWSYGLPEPSWGDPSAVVKATFGTAAQYTSDAKSRVVGRGGSGLFVGHNHDNQYAEVSDLELYPV